MIEGRCSEVVNSTRWATKRPGALSAPTQPAAARKLVRAQRSGCRRNGVKISPRARATAQCGKAAPVTTF